MSNYLNCKITSKNGEELEVEIEGRSINLPISLFPANIKVSDEFQLFLYSSKNPAINDQSLAKSLLEEILNGK